MPPEEPAIDECEVLDKDRLSKYRSLREKWVGWIESDPNHSLWGQPFSMVTNDLAVNTIAYAAESDPESPLHNQLLVRTISQGHRDAQILAVRRLLDKRRDVISLRRLLTEIKDNLELFTREIYVAGDGAPYEAAWNSPPAMAELPELRDFFASRRAHQQFDRLAQVRADNRTRTDRIPPSFIEHLEAHLKSSRARDVVKWSHQFIAHAGDVKAKDWRSLEITFDAVTSAQKAIAQVVQLISWPLLQSSALGFLVPTEQNPFARFDRLVSREAFEQTRKRRDELERDRNSWLHSSGKPDLLTVIGWPTAPDIKDPR